MTSKRRCAAGFSLVEVTLAIGIVAFALITLLALMPVGLKTNRKSIDEIAALGMLTSLESDLRTSPSSKAQSVIFKIDRSATTIQGTGSNKIYLNAQGEPTVTESDKRYRLIVENLSPMAATPIKSRPYTCRAKIAWPAAAKVREDGATTETAQGTVEIYLSIYVL